MSTVYLALFAKIEDMHILTHSWVYTLEKLLIMYTKRHNKNVQIPLCGIMAHNKKRNWKQPRCPSVVERIIFYIAVFSYSNEKE